MHRLYTPFPPQEARYDWSPGGRALQQQRRHYTVWAWTVGAHLESLFFLAQISDAIHDPLAR
jgi:hypothetical protein